MRPVLRLVAALLLIVVGIPGRAKPPDKGLGHHPKADKHFAAGEYRLAARAYRSVVERDGSDWRAAFGLARSVAATDDCEEPLAILGALRTSPYWSAEMAVLEGACLAAMGDFAGAEAAFEETLVLGGEPRGVHPRLARLRLAAGDLDGFEESVGVLEADGYSDHLVALLRLREAVERGLPDVDERLAEARRALSDRPRGPLDGELLALDARHWLDLGEPEIARPIFVEAVKLRRRDPTVAAWSLEATRRSGDAVTAYMGSDRIGIKRAQGALIDAMRARILTDVGEVDEAAAVLDGIGPSDHAEVLASRWYLARARGDLAEQRRWAARWRVVSLRDAPIEAIVPIWDW